MRARQGGMTLIELLVAMAIMGIVFTLITNWQISTLSISTRTNAMSQQISELNDMTGYVGDRVRSALAVRTTGFTVNAASTSNAGKCDTTTPCLALFLPESDAGLQAQTTVNVNAAGFKIGPLTTTGVRYRVYIYRMEPRSSLSEDDRTDDAWANNDTNKVMVLREYRGVAPSGTIAATVCPDVETTPATDPTKDCSGVANTFLTATAFSGLQPYLVSDYLSLTDASGTAITPFAYTTANKTLTLSVQSKRSVRGSVTYTPAAPYTLDVQARNVSP